MRHELKALADGLIEVVKGYVKAAEDVLSGRLDMLTLRLDGLSAAPAGKDGERGPAGADGKSFTLDDARALLEPEICKWALDFERRAQDTLQRSLDRMPKAKDGKDGTNGKDGQDGLGFDDVTVEHDGERGFTIKYVRGDQVKQFTFVIPVVLDKGYYREGESFEKGDGVTFGGSYWIAQTVTRSKPETGNDDWRLAVKKGRDAKTPASL